MQWHQNPAPLVCLCGGGGESVGTSSSTSDSFAFNLLHPLHGRLINFDDKIVVENDITSESTSLERNIHCFLKPIPHPPKNTQTIWPNPSTSRKLSICWHKTHFHPRLLKFNIAREKWWLEDYFPIGARSLFRGELWNFGGVPFQDSSDSQLTTSSPSPHANHVDTLQLHVASWHVPPVHHETRRTQVTRRPATKIVHV